MTDDSKKANGTDTPDGKAAKLKRPRGRAALIAGKCVACGGRCEQVCPVNAITIGEAGSPSLNHDKCIGCSRCVKICPASALQIIFTADEQAIIDQLRAAHGITPSMGSDGFPESEHESLEDQKAAKAEREALEAYLARYRGVWVAVEQDHGIAATVSWELLGKGAELAKDLGVELAAVIMGDDVEHLCDDAFSYGADKVYLVDDPVLSDYRTKPYANTLCALIEKYRPEVVLIGATGTGRDLAGAAAGTLLTGLTADCTGLQIRSDRMLLMTRPAFGGNVMATILCERTRPQMSTVRPHVMPMPEMICGRTGTILREKVAVTEAEIVTKVLETIPDQASEGTPVDASDILITAGMGLKSAENMSALWELAEQLGGTVGGTRRTVDAGWIPQERQIGQTGKTVRPKLFIACGVSGAIQHTVGMQDSDVIIAINTDPHAPIFDIADYGIVGDATAIVRDMTEHIRQLKAQPGAVCSIADRITQPPAAQPDPPAQPTDAQPDPPAQPTDAQPASPAQSSAAVPLEEAR